MNTDRKYYRIIGFMTIIADLFTYGCSTNHDITFDVTSSFETTSSYENTSEISETFTYEPEEYSEIIEFPETYINQDISDHFEDNDSETSQTEGFIKEPVVVLADGELPDYTDPVKYYLNAVEYCDAAKFMQAYYCDTLLDYIYNRRFEKFSTYTEIFDFWSETLAQIKENHLEEGNNGELTYKITDSFELSEAEKAMFVKNIDYLELPVPEFSRARYIDFYTYCGNVCVENRCAVELQINGQWFFMQVLFLIMYSVFYTGMIMRKNHFIVKTATMMILRMISHRRYTITL